jgi:diguanylate cyclase (GGDEF)-like protein
LSFVDLVTHACERAERRPGSIAVALLDIDRFKDFNEGLGQNVGDQLLRDIADRLSGCVRKGDLVARENDGLVARRGGDEFLMLLSDVAEAHHVASAARRILDSLKRPFRVAGKEIHVTGSIGLAMSETNKPEADDLIKHAEIAMYRVKEGGGNSFQFFDAPMHQEVVERFDMESRLRRALAREELILFYQPLVNAQSRSFAGVEALIRWNHPSKGLLTADEFVPLAEETGLIIPIGRWVARTACEQLSRWRDQGYGSMRLSINLSPRELRAPGFVANLAKILEETAVQPGQLEVEITERGVMHNDAATLEVLRRLQSMGVRLAVDDFGTGHTTFHYLKNFPLNTLKIDKSFTRGIVTNGKDAAITKALLAMAHRLELNVVAEGVENEAQMLFLGEHQCDQVQGYLFGHPIPASELRAALEEHAIAV